MAFDAMLPILLSTKAPENGSVWKLPFKFVGGYGLTTREIGVVLSVQGVYSMIATTFIFPIVVRKLGALGVSRMTTLSYPLLYIVTPYIALLPEPLRMAGAHALVIWKCAFAAMAYPSNAILLTNSRRHSSCSARSMAWQHQPQACQEPLDPASLGSSS